MGEWWESGGAATGHPAASKHVGAIDYGKQVQCLHVGLLHTYYLLAGMEGCITNLWGNLSSAPQQSRLGHAETLGVNGSMGNSGAHGL